MTALPSQAMYNLKANMVKIERKRQVIPSLNKRTYTPQETMIFYLPSLANSVMDGQTAYLKFNLIVSNNTGAERTFNLDSGAWAFIDSLKIYGAGGSLVEDIQQYNVLYSALVDVQMTQNEKIAQSAAWGTEETYTTPNFQGADNLIRAAVADAGATANLLNARLFNTSQNRRGLGATLADGTSITFSFSIPILSSIFSLSDKFFPCFALQDDTRLDFTLASAVQALVSAAALTYTIDIPEIVVDYLFMDPATMAQIQSFYAGRDLVLSTTSYHSYASTLPATSSGSIQQIIPSKVISAKMLLATYRPSDHVAQQNDYSLSSRVNPCFTTGDRFHLNIGGMNVPQHPLQCYQNNNFDIFWAELQKAFHAWATLAMDGSLPRSYYNVGAVAFGANAPAPGNDDTSYRNGFLLALNLDSIVRSSDAAMAGMNLSTVTTYANYHIGVAGGLAIALSVNYFIYHDQLLVIGSDGSMTSRF